MIVQAVVKADGIQWKYKKYKPFHEEKINKVVDSVCEFYDITKSEIMSRSRSGYNSEARQLVYYIMIDIFGVKSGHLCKFFGRQNATIYHGRQHIKDLLDVDERLKWFVTECFIKC